MLGQGSFHIQKQIYLLNVIDYEEKNYEPVSAEDKNTFLNNSGFKFEDVADKTLMVLKKTQGNYEVVVYFYAR